MNGLARLSPCPAGVAYVEVANFVSEKAAPGLQGAKVRCYLVNTQRV